MIEAQRLVMLDEPVVERTFAILELDETAESE